MEKHTGRFRERVKKTEKEKEEVLNKYLERIETIEEAKLEYEAAKRIVGKNPTKKECIDLKKLKKALEDKFGEEL